MAIVEDEVRNESEEENEIEVVVEEDDADQDSDDSDDDDEEDALERKVEELERRISEDPYDYFDHIDLIQALWGLSELDRWRSAFDRLQQISLVRAEHWLLRLQTEVTLAHSAESREQITELFRQALLDCYSVPILNEWCSWALTSSSAAASREQLDEVLRRGGADPLSGRMFWGAKIELEKNQLEALSEEDPEYNAQQERVLWCLEEVVSRPLLRGSEAWPALHELATTIRDQQYMDKISKQHAAATDFLEKITEYEDKIRELPTAEEKVIVYQEYIDKVKELALDDKYSDCDSSGILKVLYERATTECLSCARARALLAAYARHAHAHSSRTTYKRVLAACARRAPRAALFWRLSMQQAEHEQLPFDAVKSIFETALAKGMESYKEAERLWLAYLEYIRRCTNFEDETDVERLRRTFRLAWDSLAEAWGEEANDCEVPLYWARLEYRRLKDPKQGKEIFEEIFKYGENKTLSKYWEALIALECNRSPPPSEHKLRDLFRRALRFVADYPPGVARLWTDHERECGQLADARECADTCEDKINEWRENYQAMKDKMTGQKQKGKQSQSKKSKSDYKKKKEDDKPKNKGKRKLDDKPEGEAKRKRDADMEVEKNKGGESSSGLKRSHDEDYDEDKESKRQRTDSESSGSRLAGREASTLFVSNLEFKVDEQKLRDELSKYGDIVSLRVKAGVKAFGGSICYCQYKTPESVEEAIKHDRTPLCGRPMFLSRYSGKKTKPGFKYATTTEKNKLFVRNLPFSSCTDHALRDIFQEYGKLKDLRIVTFKDGKPKGLAYIEYEDEASAASAIEKTNGMRLGERCIEVAVSAPPTRQASAPAPASLGQPKRDAGGGMRRTQLSNLIPSVLQRPSTSKAAANGNGDHDHPAGDQRPLTNTDFRNLLLKK